MEEATAAHRFGSMPGADDDFDAGCNHPHQRAHVWSWPSESRNTSRMILLDGFMMGGHGDGDGRWQRQV
jgi:hypothetical protein